MKKLKLRVKILLLLLFISLITAGIVGTVSFTVGRNALRMESYKKLTAIREMKAHQIENYFHQIFDQVISFSESRTVIGATVDFKRGFDKLEEEHNYSKQELLKMDSVLSLFYQTQFLEQLLYRDSTINYFSLPKRELSESKELWLSVRGQSMSDTESDDEFPVINPSGFSGSVKMEGSSTVSSLSDHITELFKQDGADGDIVYESTGTIDGIYSLINGSGAEIIGSSRKLGPEEKKLFSDAGLTPLEFRIGTDALVVVVSKHNYFLNNLSSEELAQIFTTANNWTDINPEWPEEQIKRFIPSEGSGSFHVFSEVILGSDQKALLNRPNTSVIDDGKKLKAQMATDPNAIAFFSYNYFDHDSFQKIVNLDGVKLGNPSIRNNTYSLTRPLYLVTTEAKLNNNNNIALLLNYFLNTVGTEVGTDLNRIEYWPQHANHRMLQYQYIANNPFPKNAKADLLASKEINSYNSVHKLYHPIFKSFLDRFGYYDIFLIDADDGHIIYSVEKEVDFATDILHGPYRHTNISKAYKKALQSDNPNHVFFEDFSPYLPSYNAPASFIASPVFEGDKKIGVLVVQLPIDKINQIMTDGYDWENVGLGKSGETYLVGDDYLIRNQSRFLIEDSENYFRMLEETNISHQVKTKIQNINSTIGLQPVITKGTQAALKGETGTQLFRDYRGIEVLSAYKPLNLEQLNWVIMSEIDKAEAFAPISAMFKKLLFWVLIILVIVVSLSVYFAKSISRPIQILTKRASELSSGNLEKPIQMHRSDEIGILGKSFEKMRLSLKNVIGDLQSLNQHLEEKVEERTEELHASNQQVKGIINSLADSLIIIDEKGTIEFYSPSAEKMFQYSQKEIIGENIRELTPSPHRELHDSYLENYYRTGVAKVVGIEREVYAKRKDGTTFPARLMISEIRTEKVRKFVGLVGDLTARKEADKKLRTQLTAMQAAVNGIMITETDGTIQWVNKAFTKLTGYEANEVIGQNPRILNSGKQDTAYYKKLWDTILSGESWHEEIINKRKDGTLYDEEQTITPVFGDDKQIVNFVSIKQDITERKKQEAIVLKAKKRMESELNVAKEIQMSMLPLIFPAFPKRKEVDVFADLIPAREVGGDFYDFYFIDENHFCFVVGDVSGKGVPAALMMAVTKTLLKSRASNDKSTASILTHVNDEIAKDNDAYMFITVFMAILDTNTGELVYTNAGHNPSFVLQNNNENPVKLTELHGPVVGAMEGITYKEARLNLTKGDIVFIYTDGVTEAQNQEDELFSDERLESFLMVNKNESPVKLVNGIIKEVNDFELGTEQADDITVMAIRFDKNLKTILTDSLSITITNKLTEINKVTDSFEEFAEKHQFPMPITSKFNIIFDDLLNNIVSYAFTDDESHEILIDIKLQDKKLIVTIKDDGIPFNPFAMETPDTKLSIEERNMGGLGIHLVKNLVDNFVYKRDVNNNIITLIKEKIIT